jgi:glycosyltransferase involved in cell wall biosynthesis
MEIAYIHQYFRTPEDGGALRSYYIARALVDRGHRVHMITAHNQRQRRITDCRGITVHYLPVKYHNSYGFFRRIWSFLRFAALAYREILVLPAPDLCYASSTPLTAGLPALRMLRRCKLPFVFEVRDLWPEAPVQLGILKNRWLISMARRLEKRLYRNSAAVVALSEASFGHVREQAPQADLHLVPNMADCRFFQATTRQSALDAEAPFVLCYTGALGYVNHLETLLNAVRHCEDGRVPLIVHIAGEGARWNALRAMSEELKLRSVVFHGHLDKFRIRQLLQQSDAAYISFRSDPVLEGSSPNKLFDALAAGKAVITNTGGWMRRLIEEEELGFYCAPSDPSQLSLLIQRYYQDPDLLRVQQQRARKIAESRFSRELLCNQVIGIAEKAAGMPQ